MMHANVKSSVVNIQRLDTRAYRFLWIVRAVFFDFVQASLNFLAQTFHPQVHR